MAEQTVETKNLVGIITHLQTWIESLFQDYLKIKGQYDLLNKDFQELNKKYEKVCLENKHFKAQHQHHQQHQHQQLPTTTSTVIPVYQSIVNHNPHQSHTLTQQDLYSPQPTNQQQYPTNFETQSLIVNQHQTPTNYQPSVHHLQSTTIEHLQPSSIAPVDIQYTQQPQNSNQFQYHDPMLMPSYSAQQY